MSKQETVRGLWVLAAANYYKHNEPLQQMVLTRPFMCMEKILLVVASNVPSS